MDSALVETDTAAWVVAAAVEWHDDLEGAGLDSALATLGDVGEALFDAWGGVPNG